MSTELPDWCHVGAMIALIRRNDSRHGGGTIEYRQVARITQRDVVFELNEGRVRKADVIRGRIYSGDTWTKTYTDIVAFNDPKLDEVRAANRVSNAWHSVGKAADELTRARRDYDLDKLDAAIALLQGARGKLR